MSKFDKKNDDYGLIGNILFGGKKPSQITDDMKKSLSDLSKLPNNFFDNYDDDKIHRYAQSLEVTDDAYEQLIKNMRDGKVTINSSDDAMKAYDKTVKQVKTTTTLATAGTTALNIAMKALSTVGWMLVITLITETIGYLAEQIDETIVTTEEAREKSQELTQAWKEENDVIDESISKYHELSKALQDASLTESEVANIKEDLSSIQDTLNEKFSDEIENIDLVNGKYEEQLAKLKELSKEKARDYVRKNEDNIEGDKNYLNDVIKGTTGRISRGKVGYEQRSDNDFSDRLYYSFGFRDETVVSPTTTLNDSVGFDLESILNKYENIYAKYDASAKEYRLRFKGTRDNVYNDLKNFYNDLLDLENDDVGENISSIIDTIGDSLNNEKLFDEDKISQSRQNIIDYAEAEILGNTKTNDLYYDATLAVEQYNEALASGEGIDEAKANLDEVQKKVRGAFGDGGILADINGAQDVFDELWNGVSEGAKDAENSLGGVSKSISIDTYKTAFDSISSLATAYKELTDSEYVSLETISKIKEAVGDSISNWDAYEQKLLTVKKGTAEYNQIMHDLTYATLENKLGIEGLSNADEAYITTLLKENGVINANEVAHDAVERAKAKEIIQSKLANDVSEESISSLLSEASTCDITSDAYISLVAQEIIFNNNGLKVSDKITALQQLAQQAKLTGAQYASLNALLNTPYGQDSATQRDWAKEHGFTIEVKDTKLKNGDEDWLWWKDGVSYENANEAALSLANSYFNDALKTETLTVPNYSGAGSSAGSTSTKSETEKEFNWIETALSRIQRVATNLGKTVSATWKSWTDRNSALKSQISAVNQEINTQRQAYNAYMSEANSLGLSSYYQNLVKNGAMDINTITNSDLADKISKYQEYYEAALSCEDAIIDLEDELRNLARTEFDNIAKQFDSEISLVEANISTLEAYIDQTEMKGNLVSKNYYSAMYAEESKNLSLLQQKYEQLSNKLSDGSIAQEEFNSMTTEVKEVKQAIIESTTALEEYQKTMRELDWEVFDLIEEKIGNVTEESEFLIDLLSNSKLFNNEGSMTSQGQATLGLHVANMRIYESQVKDYADEIARLDKEFANDSLDKNYLDRRAELTELQRELILQAQEEKNSIKDLMSEGYDSLLSYMDELISKRKELLSQASDARSYQKQISDINSEIARLQNIRNSYLGDTSEESKADIQRIELELKDALEEREQTEYERYISDQEKMLDALYDESEQFLSELLDNTNELISKVVDSTDANADTIKTTLENEVSAVGGTLTTEMQNLWNGADGVKGVVGGVNDTLLGIKALVQSMVKGSDTEASKNVSGATTNVTPATKPATTPSTSSTANNSSTSAKAITVGGMINASGAKIYDYAGDTSGERQFYRSNPIYRVLDIRGNYLKVRHQSLSSGTTGWFKKSDVKAYKTGGLVDYTGYAWVDGQKGKPEAFLSAKDTELFSKLKDSLNMASMNTNLFGNIQNYAKMPNFVPNGNVGNQQAMIINGDIVLPDVQTPEDFANKMIYVYDKNVGNMRTIINTDVHSKYGSHNYRRYLGQNTSVW